MEQQAASPPPPSGTRDPDHKLAMWAHLAGGILDPVCILVFLAWVPPLIIYLTNKDRSRFVAFHALQALIFQLVMAVVSLLLWIPGMLGLFFITVPVGILLSIGAFVYALVTALKAKDGHWAEYIVIGDFVRGKHGPEGGETG